MPQDQQKQTLPPQHQDHRPGTESEMHPKPEFESNEYKAAGKLKGKVALITGGDSGIGRAVAVYYAKEGADVSIVYLNEHKDAEETKRQVEQEGRKCLLIAGDVGDDAFCRDAVTETVEKLGKLDILVNNAAEQHPQKKIEDITKEQLERTFRTNIFGMFYLTQAAMPHLSKGSSIINTTSITAYRGSPQLLDYASTKGAIVAFTRSLSMNVVGQGIRVNAVAPGPIWTPLIPSTFPADQVAEFGATQPMKRPGQPEELAPAYVYLASTDSSYVSGQVIHVNGGEVING
ncbi:NAD(P)-dependent dehydrogenase, short-chain alcohol dehydrogenase family [Paenibacillus sp. cl141a]|uniref:SDR family oxidoreductase n=1 Tax=Paenibacillus TaxID=44249 RepID=UPI0001788D05|nr:MULTISPECIES: SDR family oxidoreductase [Paenibacillus]MBY0160593.1 SDR family oxidoreductase [Cytobacillus firmus]VTR56924.1 short-chain dehydrogenase/reductase SDR [Actinobacillus pleuropneumoniae]ACX67138.1 short-chain dehydrogenase/reductase SDR [Paenibacillus sp. Y412MC10]ETT68626.1 short-chain dehydrogenase/reductase SDR [Paenibacillus sp. FSL H8-457]MCI1775170.1 SDR family oxidoreductase [Paenibacillus lautus]